MNCKDVVKKLEVYIDNELEYQLRAEIQNHLKTCLNCRQELENMIKITEFMLKLPEIEPSPYFIHKTLARIRQSNKQEKILFAWIPISTMSIILVFLLSYFLSFAIQVSALEPDTRKGIISHTFKSLVKGSNLLEPVSFKRFCEKCCDILCECKMCQMNKKE